MPLILGKNPKGGRPLKRNDLHFAIDPQDSRLAFHIGYCSMCSEKVCIDRKELDFFATLAEKTAHRLKANNLINWLTNTFRRRGEGSFARREPEPQLMPMRDGTWIKAPLRR